MLMPGMLTEEQMKELDAARGEDFDRLFLTFMIQHHSGAVTMVKELFAAHGAGTDETVFKFASDANVDQTTEIARMQRMLDAPARAQERQITVRPHSKGFRYEIVRLSRGPLRCRGSRARSLSAGQRPAQHGSARRPQGRTDGRRRGRAGTSRVVAQKPPRRSSSAARTPTSPSPATTPSRATTTATRSGTSRIRRRRCSTTAYYCPASQSDVSVYKNLLFVSAEGNNGRLDCGAQGVQDTVSKERIRGIRIFDITRHREPEVRRQRADLPRLAHAHGARRSERQGQRLRLRLRLGRRSLAERARRAASARRRTRIRTRRSSASR